MKKKIGFIAAAAILLALLLNLGNMGLFGADLSADINDRLAAAFHFGGGAELTLGRIVSALAAVVCV